MHGGMGAALMSTPERVRDILTMLKRNLPIPVTAKIRLHDNLHDTMDFVAMLKSCGINALAVHGRRITQRSSEQARWNEIKSVVDAYQSEEFPIIANGDVKTHSDIQRIVNETGAAGVMIARGAASNVSIFQDFRDAKQAPLLYDIRREFAELSLQYSNNIGKVKWTLSGMIKADSTSRKSKIEIETINKAKSLSEIVKVYTEEERVNLNLNVHNVAGINCIQNPDVNIKSKSKSSLQRKKNNKRRKLQSGDS